MALTQVQTGMLGTGAVLQVVQSVNSTPFSTSSSSLVSTGISASITPKFSTSKILVMVNATNLNQNGAGGGMGLSLYRGGSQVYLQGYGQAIGYVGSLYSSGGQMLTGQHFTYLDSPSTTSSTTYNLYMSSFNGSTAQINSNGSATNAGTGTTITLMEIAG